MSFQSFNQHVDLPQPLIYVNVLRAGRQALPASYAMVGALQMGDPIGVIGQKMLPQLLITGMIGLPRIRQLLPADCLIVNFKIQRYIHTIGTGNAFAATYTWYLVSRPRFSATATIPPVAAAARRQPATHADKPGHTGQQAPDSRSPRDKFFVFLHFRSNMRAKL